MASQYSRSYDGMRPANALYQGLHTESQGARELGADQQQSIEMQAVAEHSEDGYLRPTSPSSGSDGYEPAPNIRTQPSSHGCIKKVVVAAVILALTGIICGFVLRDVLNSE